jgi:hypothetical protein
MYYKDGTPIPAVPSNDPFYNFREVIGTHIHKMIQAPLCKLDTFCNVETIYINRNFNNITFRRILIIQQRIEDATSKPPK